MPKTYKRSRRISDLIQREIANLLRRDIRDPRLSKLVITDVIVTDDLHLATIYYTLLDPLTCKEVQKALEKATGFLRNELSKSLQLRYVPQLRFLYDESLIRAEKITTLIDKIVLSDEDPNEET
jgi:ribosome-binding factor A